MGFELESGKAECFQQSIAAVITSGIQQQIGLMYQHFGASMLEEPLTTSLALNLYSLQERLFIQFLELEVAGYPIYPANLSVEKRLVRSYLEEGIVNMLSKNYAQVPILGGDGDILVLSMDRLAKENVISPEITALTQSPEFVEACNLVQLRLLDLCSEAASSSIEMPVIVRDSVAAYLRAIYGDPDKITVSDLSADIAYRFNLVNPVNTPLFWIFAGRFKQAARDYLVKIIED